MSKKTKNIFENFREGEEESSFATKNNRTILEDMQLILNGLRKHNLSQEFWDEYGDFTEHICETYSLTKMEALFFTIFLEKSDWRNRGLEEIEKIFSCYKVKILSYLKVINSLCDKRLVRKVDHDGLISYRVPMGVVNAVSEGKPYCRPPEKNLTVFQFFRSLRMIFEENEQDYMLPAELCSNLISLVNNNLELDFIKRLAPFEMTNEVMVLFLSLCHRLVNYNEEWLTFDDLRDIESGLDLYHATYYIEKGDHPFFTHKLLEIRIINEFLGERYRLTNKVKKELLFDVYAVTKTVEDRDLIDAKSIRSKQLFYNPKEKKQIATLSRLLQPAEFDKIRAKLSDGNMPIGFTCIFYGAPGTGKTETAMQLARETGRDIFRVNISKMKSKWFGASEEIVKELFDQYQMQVERSHITPILLFNEADAIFSMRKSGKNNAEVGRTENAIQSIILQEMEKLEGILIATTNLTENLDAAFERRFLYKIRFEQPSLEAKEAIWKLMLKDDPSVVLKNEQYRELATKYDFSGGQIENIARKCQVEYILSDKTLGYEQITLFCDEELLFNESEIKPIGFVGKEKT